MSYVPPHARKNNQNQNVNDKSNKHNKLNKPEKAFKQEFPQLATPITNDKPKLDFSKLFKNIEKKRQAKSNKMKWGMVKLTKNGMIDSLTVEERQAEDFKNEDFRVRVNLENMRERILLDQQKRMDEDPDYEPYILESSSSEEEYESEEIESEAEAEDPEEDEF